MLDGVRVVDLSRVLAGPVCGRILADLGADVIKVEPSTEDLSRYIAPKDDRGMSGLYTLANVGKRNLSLDYHKPGAAGLVLDLVRRADLVIENFRPGVLERMGLGWKEIERANPRAVLLSLNGYGSESQWSERPAFAPTIHAVAGLLQYEAEWQERPIAPLADNRADMAGALHGAIAALAALRAAERSGRGQHVEVALFDAVLASYSETPFELLPEPRHRDETRLFDAGPHGWIALAGPAQNVWYRLRKHLELDDPARPGEDVPAKARRRHRRVEEWMAGQPSREALFESIEAAGLAAAPVQSLREALTGPLARERDLLAQVDDRRGGTRPVVRAPYRFAGATCPVRRPAPRRGEHNGEILREVLGYDARRIEELVAAGVLSSDSPPEI